jgi:DNA polymerase-1
VAPADARALLTGDWVGHDVKKVWRRLGRLPGRAWDAMLASYLLDPDRGGETVERLARVLADMEEAGVQIDAAALQAMSSAFAAKLQALEEQAHRIGGGAFNLDSPKQVGEVLYDRLGLPVLKKTETGRSTDAEVLEKLAATNPLPKLLLDHRFLSKLKGTYLDALPALIDHRTGRVHTTFHQAGTGTGRISSSDPNLQNIPARTEEGQQIRRAFVARAGSLLVVADYSQIELRILAHMSGDPVLQRSFREGRDIHASTAAEIHGVTPDRVTAEMRREAKTINFGILYGMSAHGLSQRLGIPAPEAKKIIDRCFERFGKVRGFLDGILAGARAKGYVETLFGRRRFTHGIDSRNGAVRQAAERAAINAPIQGTAADLIKIAMVRVHEPLRERNASLILQVHDELVVEAPEARVDEAAELLARTMEGVATLSVPLKVDLGRGLNWASAK